MNPTCPDCRKSNILIEAEVVTVRGVRDENGHIRLVPSSDFIDWDDTYAAYCQDCDWWGEAAETNIPETEENR